MATPPRARAVKPPPGFGGSRRSAGILPPPRFNVPAGVGHGRLQDFRGRFAGGGVGVHWIGLEASGEYLKEFASIVGETTSDVMDGIAEQAETRMKLQAPWEDRTGEARKELRSVTIHDEESGRHQLFLGHGVEYGQYLETMQGGRFQIIQPTLRWVADVLGRAIARDIEVKK